jgi:hypothetical protein
MRLGTPGAKLMLWAAVLVTLSWIAPLGIGLGALDIVGLALFAVGTARFATHSEPHRRSWVILLVCVLLALPCVAAIVFPWVVGGVDPMGWFLTLFIVAFYVAVGALAFFITLAVGWSKRPRFDS